VAPSTDDERLSLSLARVAVEASLARVAFKPAPWQGVPKGAVQAVAVDPIKASPIDQPYGYPATNEDCANKDIATARCSFGLMIEERFPVRLCVLLPSKRHSLPSRPSRPRRHTVSRPSFFHITTPCSQYDNGPSMWPADPWGAYSMIDNAPAAFLDDKFGQNHTRCPRVPAGKHTVTHDGPCVSRCTVQ